MHPRKKLKCDLNDDEVVECMELVDKNNFEDLYKKLYKSLIERPIYPDGTDSSKTRLIFYAIKNEKMESLKAISKWGINFRGEYWNVPDGYENYSSLSPIYYCIEKNCSMEVLHLLLEQGGPETVPESYIKCAILANNWCALEKLVFLCPNYFDMRSIMTWHSSYPEKGLLKIIDAASWKSAQLGVEVNCYRYRTLCGTPTLIYLAKCVPREYSFEECDYIVSICKHLGCSVNSRQENEYPLQVATESKNINFAKALIKNGADVDSVHGNGKSMMYEALLQNDDDLFNFLLLYGADSRLHNSSPDNDCALYFVLRKQDTDRISQIIKLDQNLNVIGKTADSFSFFSSLPAAFHILQYLAESDLIDAPLEFLKTVIKTCIEMNFDLNTKWPRYQQIKGISFKGHTILHLAIRFFYANFCQELVDWGADVNLLSDYYQCAHSLTIDYLLGMFGENEHSNTNLEKFSFIKNNGMTWGLKLPVPPNKNSPVRRPNRRFLHLCDAYSRTAIQILLAHKKCGLLVLLFPHLVTSETLGTEEVEMAFKTGSFRITHLVLSKLWRDLSLVIVGVSNLKYLFFEEELMNYKLSFSDTSIETLVFKSLSLRGFDMNSVDSNGNGIFHYAARSLKFSGAESVKNFFQVMTSVEGHASMDRVNKNLQTPLYWALSVKMNNSSVISFVELILSHGADFRRKTIQGSSAIHIAVNSGSTAFVELLVDKSGPKKNVVNLWRKLSYLKKNSCDNIDSIEEITWPSIANDQVYTITPLTIAIMNKNKVMIKLLMSHGAILAMRDIHNSFYLNNYNDLTMANFLFEFLPKSHLVKFDRMDNNAPTLDYIFYKLSEKENFDSDALMTLTENYVSREYDINHGDSTSPPIIASLIRMAIGGKGEPVGNVKLFTYLMEHSNCEFVEYPLGSESLLTFLFSSRFCIHMCFHSQGHERGKINTKIASQRKYFIRMLLQKCPYSKWTTCHFQQYVFHLEDEELLHHVSLTGARTNLCHEVQDAQICRFAVGPKLHPTITGLLNFQMKLQYPPVKTITLADMATMALGNISEDLRKVLNSLALPDKTTRLIQFLDVETDKTLNAEIKNPRD